MTAKKKKEAAEFYQFTHRTVQDGKLEDADPFVERLQHVRRRAALTRLMKLGGAV